MASELATVERCPLVSVITPSLNQGGFLEDTIRSVLRQDYPRIEHIVIDGGSNDHTLQILRRHPQLVWRSAPDGGQSEAVNRGLWLARGEILGWLNADDTYLAGAVGGAVRYLEEHPEVDLLYGECHVIDEAGTLMDVRRGKPYEFRKLLTLDRSIPQPSVFFRRRVIDRVGALDPTMHLAMDFDFWVRVGRRCRIACAPGVGSTLRMHAATKSVRRGREVLPDILATLHRAFADPELPRDIARLKREALSAAYVADGIRAYNVGDRHRARRLLIEGLRRYPHPLRMRNAKAALVLVDTLAGTRIARWLRSLAHRWHRRQVPASITSPPSVQPGRVSEDRTCR